MLPHSPQSISRETVEMLYDVVCLSEVECIHEPVVPADCPVSQWRNLGAIPKRMK